MGRFQFTPLREGRRNCPLRAHLGRISIHAPPRGATPPVSILIQPHTDFNSRPSARGDKSLNDGTNIAHDFNSRPSARGDATDAVHNHIRRISIHAPPRGATWLLGGSRGLCHFNSRPSARGDAIKAFSLSDVDIFQFTPLREGRHALISAAERAVLFQFTPLREGRLASAGSGRNRQLFQFTPLREGRLLKRDAQAANEPHFNSRPSARGDREADAEVVTA